MSSVTHARYQETRIGGAECNSYDLRLVSFTDGYGGLNIGSKKLLKLCYLDHI